MTAPDRDPLTPEERAVARQLQRLGAPDGPSAAIDARILAAARTAAAPERASHARARRRRAAWLPPGAVTAIGTAAALVVVVGAVWQLRPVDRPPVHARLPGDDGVVEVELLGPREEHAPASRVAGPDASSDAAAPAQRSVGLPQTRRAVGPQAPAHAAPAPATGFASPTAEPAAAAAGSSTQEHQPPAALPLPGDAAAAPTGAAALPAPTAAGTTPPGDGLPPADEHRPRRATYTTAARARPESQRDRGPVPGTTRTRAPESVDLAAVPVEADAQLAPAAWLERIRDRRDAGDVERARASLRRFERAHPRLRLPRDLRELGR